MSNSINRRNWLKQSTLAALGLTASLNSLGGEDYLPKDLGQLLPNSNPSLINLGSNENPYGLSPLAKKAISELIGQAHRYQYNIPHVQEFRKQLADYYGVTTDHLLLTPGSGEALNLLARHYSKGNLVTATPTFGILPNTAKKIGVQVKEIPLDGQQVHDLEAFSKAIDPDTAQVYICNPANPTGTVLHPDKLRAFCEEASKKTVVTIDEAYIDFLDAPYNESMLSLVKKGNKNIVIIRTFSKIHAMAGMRVGFILADPSTIKSLQENYFGNSNFCMSALSLTAAMASLKDTSHSIQSKKLNAAARQYTEDALKRSGFTVIPSYTNFIFFHLKQYKGDFAADMLAKNIVLRSSELPDGKYCRVSIGTLEEMKAFLKTMESMKFT
ncbi:histidinol-phosphate aminotransferase family protein [Flavihumibacter sp. RY-1]|uniref:Histidinol-phosphate aminotransferase family protein n=1 Tax=Flavihumibacter fluminis TaxID=2909236 RepID=A0ABS9BCP7_9BACT|nr:histidinol-phosphate transaminase [Flavihumibacter fluminis]MCF1713443.1 histidinol-phosphate aminotransferase family protein [Flavihumibacter fluminis]